MTKTRKNRNGNRNKTKKHVFTKKDYNSGDGMLTTVLVLQCGIFFI